jgi:hypothetical protein
MDNLTAIINKARIRTRTSTIRSNLITDANLLILVADILEECRLKMVEVESNLVYTILPITTVADTKEYALSTALPNFDSMMENGVFVDNEGDPLTEALEEDSLSFDLTTTDQPTHFYLTEDNKIGFLPIPDDAYSIYCYYFPTIDALGTIDGNLEVWRGIWDSYICKRLQYEINYIYERDTSALALEIISEEDAAMNRISRYGHRVHRRIPKSDFFSVVGI